MKFYFRGYNCVFLNSIFFLFFFFPPSLFSLFRFPIYSLSDWWREIEANFKSTVHLFSLHLPLFLDSRFELFPYFTICLSLFRWLYPPEKIFWKSNFQIFSRNALYWICDKKKKKKISQFFLKDHNTSVNFLLYRSSIFDLIIKFQMVFHIKKKKNSFLVENK